MGEAENKPHIYVILCMVVFPIKGEKNKCIKIFATKDSSFENISVCPGSPETDLTSDSLDKEDLLILKTLNQVYDFMHFIDSINMWVDLIKYPCGLHVKEDFYEINGPSVLTLGDRKFSFCSSVGMAISVNKLEENCADNVKVWDITPIMNGIKSKLDTFLERNGVTNTAGC